MKVVIERCAGLDVHKKTMVACVRTPRSGRAKGRLKGTRTFATTMKGLGALRAWLASHRVTDAAMESTGVYWRPVWAVLEDDFRLLLVNARHVKQVPGRKTDVRDCEWLAQLLECGLLRGSFVPSPEIRDLRDLTRLRKTLVRERSSQVNWVSKILELANIKLGSVVSNVMGVTARRILDAMIAGEDDPEVLAGLAKGSLRGKRRELAEAVPGLLRDHHRFVLRRHLDLIDELTHQIARIEARIVAQTSGPFGAALDLLESIPGVGHRSAEAILAETGDDMSKFPTAAHFASWARVCPGNHESAGKRKSASIGKGNAWLRDALSQVAWAAARTKGSYYRALYYRRRARGGPKKAIVAVQHAILVAIWHMLTTGSFHEGLGPDHFERHARERRKRHLINQLKKMGVDIEIKEQAA
ncbi:MAG: IS110 family transposase [Gammaproteobacteria bacterium]|nr:IS110 family transposase [Gammaproteobacteria bacterium]MDE0246937.1 IS110 family transposase [Gammaproteobacteria bacterium]